MYLVGFAAAQQQARRLELLLLETFEFKFSEPFRDNHWFEVYQLIRWFISTAERIDTWTGDLINPGDICIIKSIMLRKPLLYE